MDELIEKLASDLNWAKWTDANGGTNNGCISHHETVGKDDGIGHSKDGCIS